MTILRHDKATISKTRIDDDGFLHATPIVTRTGVFTYINADGTIRRELRHPEDVLKAVSLDSMKMIPITKRHPAERIVNADNAKKLKVGNVGENIEHDGEFIKAPITVQDKDAIQFVMDGANQLSLGYRLDLVEESGTYKGEAYNYRQKNITYNHLAIVEKARAGEKAQIVLDSADAIEYEEDNKPQPKPKDQKMVKINIDGIEYDSAPEVKNFVEKTLKKNSDLTNEVKTANDEKEKLSANLDEANKKVADFEKIDNEKAIQEGVNAKLELVSKATPHLDGEEIKGLAQKSDLEIKKMVIGKNSPDLNLDEKEEAYIDASFDIALDALSKKKVKKQGQEILIANDKGEETSLADVKANSEKRQLELYQAKA